SKAAITSLDAAHELWLTRVTVFDPPDPDAPPSPPPSDEQADSVTSPSPTARTVARCVTFLVMLTEFLLEATRKRRGPARDRWGPGQGATARVVTDLPTQNDLGEVRRVCGRCRTLSAVALPCRNMKM